jgi:hypothetical protein
MTAVKMIWTADHLDAARLLQDRILAPARAAAAVQRAPWSWLAVIGVRLADGEDPGRGRRMERVSGAGLASEGEIGRQP